MVVKVNTMNPITLTSIPQPDGNILLEEANTTVYVGNEQIGTGTVYIAESKFQWICSASGLGFTLEYRRIAVHAISYDLSQFPEECVFLMVEKEKTDNSNEDNEEEDDEDEEDSGSFEMILVPSNKQMIPGIFEAIRQCQALHPDPDQSLLSDDEDEEDDEFEDAHNNVMNGHADELLPNGHHITFGSSEDEGMDLEEDDQFQDAPN